MRGNTMFAPTYTQRLDIVKDSNWGQWTDQPWSYWLPAMIKADFFKLWIVAEVEELPESKLSQTSFAAVRELQVYSGYSPRLYFCTNCPDKGALHEYQIHLYHAGHRVIGVARHSYSALARVGELEGFFDVSDVKMMRGDDGHKYVRLRSLAKPNRRVNENEVSCTDCVIIKTSDRRNILSNFCSVECQLVSKMSREAAITFSSLLPEDPIVSEANRRTRFFKRKADTSISPALKRIKSEVQEDDGQF